MNEIVITKDNFKTITNIVIIDPTCINLVQDVSTMTMYAMIVASQKKAQSYIERVPRDDFILFAIETYNCFHPCFDSFLTSCVHAYITHHQQSSLIPLMLISHYRQQMTITP